MSGYKWSVEAFNIPTKIEINENQGRSFSICSIKLCTKGSGNDCYRSVIMMGEDGIEQC